MEHEIDSHNKQTAVRSGHWVDLTKRLSKESVGRTHILKM